MATKVLIKILKFSDQICTLLKQRMTVRSWTIQCNSTISIQM